MRWLPEDDPRRQVWERCESAIEQILCTTLFADFGLSAVSGDFSTERLPEMLHARPMAYLFAQQWIAGYRTDFLLVVTDREGCVLFAIECDGRQFHSSEEQIAYDEQRDDVIRLAGCREVLRFTGTDIVRHARFTANSIWRLLEGLGISPERGEGCDWYCLWANALRTPEARPRLSPEEDFEAEQEEARQRERCGGSLAGFV